MYIELMEQKSLPQPMAFFHAATCLHFFLSAQTKNCISIFKDWTKWSSSKNNTIRNSNVELQNKFLFFWHENDMTTYTMSDPIISFSHFDKERKCWRGLPLKNAFLTASSSSFFVPKSNCFYSSNLKLNRKRN